MSFHDPSVTTWVLDGAALERVDDLQDAVAAADLTLLLQAHSAYDVTALARTSPLFFDTRGVVRDGSAVTL